MFWLTISLSGPLAGWGAPHGRERSMLVERMIMNAEGKNRSFRHVVTTRASERAIWSRWSDVASWGEWDGGLRSASLKGPFAMGTGGTIVPLSGTSASFVIVELTPGRSYTFETSLPLATLIVLRRFLPKAADGRTMFQHEVSFGGFLGWFWASQFGPGFRKELPPTMERLARLAEQDE
jgi:hypothetical protein